MPTKVTQVVSILTTLREGKHELTSESDLIRRAQLGDHEAFCHLARKYQRRLYALALHYCRCPEDAEDLSQEVWLKAFRAIDRFREQSSFYTWLRQITINTFLNDLRRGVRGHARARSNGNGVRTQSNGTSDQNGKNVYAPFRIESLSDYPDDALALNGTSHRESENGLHQSLLVGRAMRALSELTSQQRLVFLLKHREGMTCKEISEAVGISIGSVKKSLYRSVQKLRDELGATDDVEECVILATGDGG